MDLEDDSIETRLRWEDAVEVAASDYVMVVDDDSMKEMRKIDWVISRMILGDITSVKHYLDTSSESQIFLHGTDSNGKTALILAAGEGYPMMIKLLLERGADHDTQDTNRRTALMEAALWGRFKNVEHLLDHGADKDIKDIEGLKAIDFATVSKRNEEERYWRSGGQHQTYKEVVYIPNQARRMIVSVLKPKIVDRLRFAEHKDQFFHWSHGKIRFYAPVATYDIENAHKTIARLQRGGSYSTTDAMSGRDPYPNHTRVSGRMWSAEVFRIADIIGHTLAPDPRDGSIPGSFNASHAE